MTERLRFEPALARTDLLAGPVAEVLAAARREAWYEGVEVAEIDPAAAGGTDFCTRYAVPLDGSGNCIVVDARRGDQTWLGACVVMPDTRADLNGSVRRHFGARRVSLMDGDEAVVRTAMEYGSITPVGLPKDWTVLLDASLAAGEAVIVGSGIRRAKLRLPGPVLQRLAQAVVVEGLAQRGSRVA